MKKKYLSLPILLGLLCGCSPIAYDVNDYRQTMIFHEDFKILQLTDLHLGIESDLNKQFTFIKNSINEVKPDLIICTGDNFMYASKNIVNNTITFINNCCNSSFDCLNSLIISFNRFLLFVFFARRTQSAI